VGTTIERRETAYVSPQSSTSSDSACDLKGNLSCVCSLNPCAESSGNVMEDEFFAVYIVNDSAVLSRHATIVCVLQTSHICLV